MKEMSEQLKSSLRVLLSEIIDYAGLFPPSELSMAEAVKNYSQYLKSENSWMLGRFVVPSGRLNEFASEAEKLFSKKSPWRLSVIANEGLSKSLKAIEEFNASFSGKAIADTLEIKVDEAGEIHDAAQKMPEYLTAYFEIPQSDILIDFVTALALTKQRAKLRTGGVTIDAFPSTDTIIKFMRICVAANIPFKATAGLHHPLRCTKPLTYQEDAPIGMMHGFFNLFLTACFLRGDLNNSFVYKLMNEMDGKQLKFEEDSIQWADKSLPAQVAGLVREKNAISFGSCSFLEPIEDLRALGLLT